MIKKLLNFRKKKVGFFFADQTKISKKCKNIMFSLFVRKQSEFSLNKVI